MPGFQDTKATYVSCIESIVNNVDREVSSELVIETLKSAGESNSAILEASFRSAFYRILASCNIDDDSFSSMWRLLDAVSIASDAEICDPGLSFLLVEELLDSQTICGCRKVFDYLESRRERMTAKHWKSKHLVILRSCNELLKRLSRAEDTIFCGRVYIFLFQSFPLGDKSSVNLRGEYHTDHVTQYDEAAAETGAETMEVDEKEDSEHPPAIQVEGKETVDTDALYPIFWSLQEFFAQPTKLFEASRLGSFKTGLETTLKKFKEVHRNEPRSSAKSPDENQGTKRKLDNPDGDNFNPRYLTSRDLFELEIHDPAFRRHILVQALIVVDFLLSQTPKAKIRLENLKNKSIIYDFVLDESDAQWATQTRSEIATYLQQGPEGKFYYRMVDTVLSRDRNWLRWKAESCPPFQLNPTDPESFLQGRVGIEEEAAPRRIRKTPMAALDLSFLDSERIEGDPLIQYRAPERWKQPDLGLLRGAIMDADFEMDMAKTDEEKKTAEDLKASNTWRALRVGGRFGQFDKLDDGKNLDALFGIEREEVNDEPEEEEIGTSAGELVHIEVGAEDKEDGREEDDAKDGEAAKEDNTNEEEVTAADTKMAGQGDGVNDAQDNLDQPGGESNLGDAVAEEADKVNDGEDGTEAEQVELTDDGPEEVEVPE